MADFSHHVDIVRGLNSFGPVVLLTLPLEPATLCFSALYHSFHFRRWLANFPEAEARDEYLEFFDYFRRTCYDVKDRPESFTDKVAFLILMPEIRMRKHLFYIFRLISLCLTAISPELPAVEFPGVDSGDPRSRLLEVIMPPQLYLATVPESVAICTT